MAEDFQIVQRDGSFVAQISTRGREVLRTPWTNQGTGFTEDERAALGLTGMLPPRQLSLHEQSERVYQELHRRPTELQKFIYLHELECRNVVLFYHLLDEHIEELLPIVYTPTIGEAIQEYSHWFTRPRGIFLDINHPERIEASLLAYDRSSDDVDIVVATDAEGILGIGDQGVGGVMIAIGKLVVYTAAAGIHPSRMLPVVIDCGTNNPDLLNDPLYLGLRQPRVSGAQYDEFIQAYFEAVTKCFPNALVHWEDFAAGNAHRILEHYRHQHCSFNDDIQGTAGIVAAAVLSALQTSGGKLSEQRIITMGAGSAGIGIANLLVDLMVQEGLSPDAARSRFWGLNSGGLMVSGGKLRDYQEPFARPRAEVADWTLADANHITLSEVVRHVDPTIIIGTSAQPGAVTQEIVEHMSSTCERPIIFCLSNPTKKSEGIPADILTWSKGRALIATGSPYAPVEYNGTTYQIAQANNSLIFPGIGLGTICCRPTEVTDSMIAACAKVVAADVADRSLGAPLLPPVTELKRISAAVAEAFIRAAVAEGYARIPLEKALGAIAANMWEPQYPTLELI